MHEVSVDGDLCEICTAYVHAFSGNPTIKMNATGVMCVVDGCDEPVLTRKGATAGYCTKIQSNGRSHRMDRMDFLREKGSTPGVKPKVIGGSHWLVDVKERINAALDEVEKAEDELGEAKTRLREILDEAQEAIK